MSNSSTGIVPDSTYSSLEIPIARREFIKITKIERQGEDMTSFRFDWRWKPNIILRALDPAFDDCKSLPARLRERLHSIKPDSSLASIMEDDCCGVADFVNTDDGWRLLEVFFDELSDPEEK